MNLKLRLLNIERCVRGAGKVAIEHPRKRIAREVFESRIDAQTIDARLPAIEREIVPRPFARTDARCPSCRQQTGRLPRITVVEVEVVQDRPIRWRSLRPRLLGVCGTAPGL